MAGYYERHTPEAWQIAEDTLKKGLGYGEASRRSGISHRGIQKRFPGQGRPVGGAHDRTVREQAERLLADGVSYREVEATLGVSRHTVAEWFPGRGWTSTEGGQLLKVLHDNSTLTMKDKMWDMNRRHRGVR